jgi:hypothetical protein
MPALLTPHGRLLNRSAPLSRASFRAALMAILGDTRFLWMPRPTDATTNETDETFPGRTITYDATVVERLSKLGLGYAQSFTAASSQYGTGVDTANMSFGNATVDVAFSIRSGTTPLASGSSGSLRPTSSRSS